ncbi:hypothetical protein HPB49_004925 [Dermacentor silvarum]|uniref:Uncharacterized protein n=1 Tax=Dermacentor silvarum TaxID=543639 RepID=A0ACB8CPW4_DERSI|nr:hypothetical protein HPB49_004925 [Dermacentor silvarum]
MYSTRTELMAIPDFLEWALETFHHHVYTDSQAAHRACANVLYTDPVLQKIWHQARLLRECGHDVTIHWVPAHCSNPGNEKAHRLARAHLSTALARASDTPYPLLEFRQATLLTPFLLNRFHRGGTPPNITGFCSTCKCRADLNHLFWECPFYIPPRLRAVATIKRGPWPSSLRIWACPDPTPPDHAIELWRALLLFLQDPAAPPVGAATATRAMRPPLSCLQDDIAVRQGLMTFVAQLRVLPQRMRSKGLTNAMSLGECITFAKTACPTHSKVISQVEVGTQYSLPLADKSVECSFKAGRESRSVQTTETVDQSSYTSATVSTIIRSAEKFEKEKCSLDSGRKRIRQGAHKEMEEALYEWFLGARAPNLPITGMILATKAKQFALLINNVDFHPRGGWIERCLHRRTDARTLVRS